MGVNILNSSLMELHVRKHQRSHPQIRYNDNGNNNSTDLSTDTRQERQLHADLRTVSDQLLQRQIQIQNLQREINLHRSQNHNNLQAGTIVDWGIDDDYEMTGSNGSSATFNDFNSGSNLHMDHNKKLYSLSEWTKEDDDVTEVEINNVHGSIDDEAYHSHEMTLSRLADQVLQKHHDTAVKSNLMIDNLLEKFKYDIIASNVMKEDELHHSANSRLTSRNKPPSSLSNFLFINEFNQLPYKHFVHSFQVVILVRGLLHYGIHTSRTKKNRQLISLICLSLINLYSRTREVILRLYLQALQNRLTQFLDNNNSLDYFLNKNTRLLKKYQNELHSMNRIFPPYRTKQFTGVNAKIVNSSKLLTTSIFSSLIISLNLKIANILPFVNPEYLEEYLSIYQLDMINDPKGELKFITILNQFNPLTLPSLDERRLKPLKLRSVSASPSPNITSHEFDHSSQAKKANADFQLSDDPSTLATYFKSIRKIFMCTLLSILEDAKVADDDKDSRGRFFYNICIKKFRSKVKSASFVPMLDKIYMMINLFNSTNSTIMSFINELNDFQTYNNYSVDLSDGNDGDYSDILDDSQLNENLALKFTNSMDQISNKLAFLELNHDIESDQLNNLLLINNDLSELLEMYNDSVKYLQGKREAEELNIRKSSFEKFKPLVSSPLTTISDINLNASNNAINDSKTKKRNSTGLNFNLVRVIESSDEDIDLDQKENLVISIDEGTRSIPTDEKIDGVLSKDELTKTLERLNGMNLGDISSSTPRNSIDFTALENPDDDPSETVIMDHDLTHGLGLNFVVEDNKTPRSDLSNENFSLLINNEDFHNELKHKLQSAFQ